MSHLGLPCACGKTRTACDIVRGVGITWCSHQEHGTISGPANKGIERERRRGLQNKLHTEMRHDHDHADLNPNKTVTRKPKRGGGVTAANSQSFFPNKNTIGSPNQPNHRNCPLKMV